MLNWSFHAVADTVEVQQQYLGVALSVKYEIRLLEVVDYTMNAGHIETISQAFFIIFSNPVIAPYSVSDLFPAGYSIRTHIGNKLTVWFSIETFHFSPVGSSDFRIFDVIKSSQESVLGSALVIQGRLGTPTGCHTVSRVFVIR